MECEKCSYESEKNNKIPGTSVFLCSICRKFAPQCPEELKNYLEEKLDWKILETFRSYKKDKNIEGMRRKAEKGSIVSRAAFGYKIENKQLVPDQERSLIIQEIFQTFLNDAISLNQLAKKYKFSVNGIKKMLKNFTYIGKVKFAGQVIQGSHKPLISTELFNKVQNKLENIEKNYSES